MPRIFQFWRQSVATTLIFVLLLSQTIRVDFFSEVQASQDKYRDIISIFVDTETYKENRVKINRYAEDIQTYLGSTRSSIFVVERDTSPAVIASKNEKLYYEGDGEKGIVSHLVGTILIGDIAIPMVDTGKDQFPSVYPYVDFVDKKFLYNEQSGRYIIADNDNQKIVEPEIWHGVINPAVGRKFEYVSQDADPTILGSVDTTSDIEKIGLFLDKTNEFYTQKGVFAPSPYPPRVFYYDGFLEAKSFAMEDLGAYEVYMDSAEEVIYNRFSKYFLKYVIEKIEEEKKKFNKDELAYIDSLGFPGSTSNIFPLEQISKIPDIQTKPIVMELLKKFHELINAKSLGDIRAFVRNAGRYNDGPDIRMDQPAISISLMDYTAMNTLRQANDKLEKWVDSIEIVDPSPVVIMDYLTIKEPFTIEGKGITRHYDNYLFGRQGATIFDPQFCTIARGSDTTIGPYKQGILVEANAAFDVYSVTESMKLFERDGSKGINCVPQRSGTNELATYSYWGGNIITNVDTDNNTFKEKSWTQDFYVPIFSLAGMREIYQSGSQVLHEGPQIVEANPSACDAAYSSYPYMLQAGAIREDGRWPNDAGRSGSEVSCLTTPEGYSQPTWEGRGDPNTRQFDQERYSHYLGPTDGQCINGQVAINLTGISGSIGFTPQYVWSCLPPIDCENPEKGKTHYECFSQKMNAYIRPFLERLDDERGLIVGGRCDGSSGKLFSSACGYNDGNDQEAYWKKIPNGSSYRSPCFAGKLIFDGVLVPGKSPTYPCVSIGYTSTQDENNNDSNQGFLIESITDLTTYETQSFHSIDDSRVFHKSPTDEEIQAAESSNITPSLPIDHDRHVIFQEKSIANNDKKIEYANVFRFDESEILEKYRDRIATNLTDARGQERIKKYGTGAIVITAFRLALDTLGKKEWEGSLASIDARFSPPVSSCWGGQLVDNPSCSPATIDGPLTDDDIVSIIRANRWLNPDVTTKMRQAVETGLSYSHVYGSGGYTDIDTIRATLADTAIPLGNITGTISSPPQILTLTGGYEVAYLGLTDFIPQGGDGVNNDQNLSDSQDAYREGRNQISALNISEQEAEESQGIRPAASDNCGPPEGVDLFQWPSAIMCWIKSLTPVRIVGQACGTNTIGFDGSLVANSPPGDFQTGGILTYHIPRDVMLPSESLEARFFYTKDNRILSVPENSTIKLDVLALSDTAGKSIDILDSSDYINITPNTLPYSPYGTMFLVQSRNTPSTIQLRATLTIPDADAKTLQVQSDIITIDISDEYLVAVSSVDDVVTSQIPVISLTGMIWDMTVRNMSGELLEPRYPITLDIYDDISQSIVQTGITIDDTRYILPSQYTKTIGVYRLEFSDALGRHATNTIAVTAGKVAKVSLSPMSSALLKGSNTLVTLRLRDVFGNPVSPDLHSIDMTAEGGYFIMENGEKKNKIHIDAIEAEVPLTVGSDISGTISITAMVNDVISTATELKVFDSARVIISRSGTPEVGGSDIPVTVRVVDDAGNSLDGFRSVVHLGTAFGGGVFAPEVAMIDNGISSQMTYSPGRLAGDQRVTASIPGLGSIPDIAFSVNPGQPMYISHRETDTSLIFSLRDRYNNIVPVTIPGTLESGSKNTENIQFVGGLLTVDKTVGYFLLNVPQLGDNTITFTDEKGTYTVRGVSQYIAFVKSLANRFDFAADYNARYTVLAGGAFLREGEDILYNTTPGSGQSLAVTTLLDTPYKRDTVFSILPGGGFDLGDSADTLPEAYLSLDGGYPLLTIRDDLTNSLITQARYRPLDPILDICSDVDCSDTLTSDTQIRLGSTMTGITAEKRGGTLTLMRGTESLVTIMENGMLAYLPGVTLNVNTKDSQKALSIDIVSGLDTLGRIIYKTDSLQSLEYQGNTGLFMRSTVYLDDTGDFHHEVFSQEKFSDTVHGYRYISVGGVRVYDEEKNAPEAIDGLGLTVESPGIGWKGNNRTLLSYAGGDTVGEATKWFHTYTMINLGDPVTHNDTKALGTELDGIDRSIGTELTSPQASPIQSYAQSDMDNDGYEDIVILHKDGYVQLLLNLGDRIRSRGNIAYIPDIIDRGFSLGDFRNDGYADIIGVDKNGELVMLSNNTRQFTRTNISVDTESTLPQGVTQFRIRDMDNDGRDDIVYLTESGELSILYGTDTVGYFDKKILDATLGLTLSDTDIKTGGALYADRIPQVSLDSVSTGDGGPDESLVWNELYVPYRYTPVGSGVDVDTSRLAEFANFDQAYIQATASPESSQSSQVKNFVRSEYAQAFSVDIAKRYRLGSGSVLRSGERITVDIDIRNTGATALRGVEYLDTIPTIFSSEDTRTYRVKSGTNVASSEFVLTSSSDYDAYFTLPDIPAGQMITLSYDLTALPTSYGELLVGDYEQGETGADAYADVGFSTDTTCGADMILWRSEDGVRTYTKGTRSFADMKLPPVIAKRFDDTNGDGVPDNSQQMTNESQQDILDSFRSKPGNTHTSIQNGSEFTIGLDPEITDELGQIAQDIADTLSCGYGGGGCMNFPVNWAPLAPGSAPVAFGYPLADLATDTGLPVFSSFSCKLINIGCGTSTCTLGLPSVFPANSMGANSFGIAPGSNNGLACGNPGFTVNVGGMLGDTSPTNYLRIYATPTLTLGAGVAMCYGSIPAISGNIPPKAIWPVVPGGNCIVLTDSLNMCKDDGSSADGDIRDVVGLGTINETWNAGNGSNAPGVGGTCSMVAKTQAEIQDTAVTQEIISYAKSPNKARLPALYTSISKKTPRTSRSVGPLLSLNGASPDGALYSLGVEIDTAKPLTASNIIKLKNKRIAGFPDFIMDWVSRQTDELVSAFFTPPTLIVIPPTSIGQNNQYDGTLSGLTDSFKSSYEQNSLSSIAQKSGQAYDSIVASRATSQGLQSQSRPSRNNAQTDIGQWIQEQQNSFDGLQDEVFQGELGKIADKGQGGVSAIRAAYKLISKLPLISISERTVPVDVPWILPQELDRYARSLDAYKKEIDYTLSQNCVDTPDSADCLNQKANAGPLIASINQNLKRIEEYKNFPIKLQKYITWKQRYLSQILCYITEVQQMTTGWAKDNSIRFRKWAELYVLIKTVADSWQPILDILAQKDANCAVCHNERYNAKYSKYKLISLLIPTLPVIQMPRWPDIVLDLSDVRLGIVIAMPNFQFNLKPIRLPNVPSFSLPNLPNATIAGFDILPALPDLPDLPDLPAIPKIQLPSLPPPPKLPKILSELKGVIDILKLWTLLECYLNKTSFVPEWTVGDVIAQRTERQGTNPLDFIDITLPQISIPTIREIRVSSHINFEVRSDFITEYARSAVEPINEFNADLGRGIPKKIGTDINISSPESINIDLQSSLPVGLTGSIAQYVERLDRDKNILLDTDEFASVLNTVLASTPELAHLAPGLNLALEKVRQQSQDVEAELIVANESKYNLLRDYIKAQYDETAHMQQVIDLLTEEQHTLALVDIDRALMVSETLRTKSTTLAEQWNRESLALLKTDESDISTSDELGDSARALSRRINRLAADRAVSPSPADTEASIAPGYIPNFKGIYIVTSQGTQTRLFDYTDSLQKDDVSTRIDIDNDGDMDYLFLLDGVLFLKRTSTYSVPKIIDTAVQVSDIDNTDTLPSAPDFYSETVSRPNSINLSYEPAQDTESIWRNTFYNRYLEWDMIARGEHDDTLTPGHIVEILRSYPDAVSSDNRIMRSLSRVADPTSVIIEGPHMEVLEGPTTFTLSPGRILYTGKSAVTLLYGTGTSEPTIEKRIPPYASYSIADIAQVSLEKGLLYVVYPSVISERYEYSDRLIGMPILPGMRISTGGGEVILLDHIQNDEFILTQNSLYHLESSIRLGNEYLLQLDYPNGFYQARIVNLDTKSSTLAGELLLTPQLSLDSSAPDVKLPESIQVPVYQQKSLLMKDIVTDTNPYTLLIDTDATQDSDNNGIYDDDFVASSLGMAVTDTSITFGPYDTLGNKNMMLKVTDDFYNTTYVPITVRIYAPIPTIDDYIGAGVVLGGLSEPLLGEPVDIFRVRPGADIRRLSTPSIVTQSSGVFQSPEYVSGSGVQLISSGQQILFSEQGITSTLPVGYSTRVMLSTADNPLSVMIISPDGSPLYRQVYSIPGESVIVDMSRSIVPPTNGLLITPSGGYTLVSASVSDPSIPGGVYITDTLDKALFAIARDGNIYPIGAGSSATFGQKDGYPQISLRVGDMPVGDILYKFDFFYTLK